MDPSQREREAEAAIRELRRKGMSRDGIFEALVQRGLTPHEAGCVLDGQGLPAGATHTVLSSPTQASAEPAPEIRALVPGPAGIGGWLLLPAIGLVLSPFQLYAAIKEVRGALAEPELPEIEQLYPGLTDALGMELAANIGLLVLTLVAAFLFFRKKRLARGVMIALLAAQALITIADETYLALLLDEPVNARLIFGALLAGTVWMLYFLNSQRVQNTFVR